MTPSALADVGTATVSLQLLSFMSLHAAWPPGALSAITRRVPYAEDLGARAFVYTVRLGSFSLVKTA